MIPLPTLKIPEAKPPQVVSVAHSLVVDGTPINNGSVHWWRTGQVPFPRIGKGADRTTYLLPDGEQVLKIGHPNSRQLRLEIAKYREWSAKGQGRWFTPILAAGDGWSVMPLVPHTRLVYTDPAFWMRGESPTLDAVREYINRLIVDDGIHDFYIENNNNFGLLHDGTVQVFDYGYIESEW